MLRFVSSGSGCKRMVRYGVQNHELADDLMGHDILGHLKPEESLFVNDMTKYHILLRYIMVALKDRDFDNPMSVAHIYKVRIHIERVREVYWPKCDFCLN